MNINLGFDNNVLSKKLREYFEENIKLALKTDVKVLFVTKNDIFYEVKHSFI